MTEASSNGDQGREVRKGKGPERGGEPSPFTSGPNGTSPAESSLEVSREIDETLDTRPRITSAGMRQYRKAKDSTIQDSSSAPLDASGAASRERRFFKIKVAHRAEDLIQKPKMKSLEQLKQVVADFNSKKDLGADPNLNTDDMKPYANLTKTIGAKSYGVRIFVDDEYKKYKADIVEL